MTGLGLFVSKEKGQICKYKKNFRRGSFSTISVCGSSCNFSIFASSSFSFYLLFGLSEAGGVGVGGRIRNW